jgi:ADP-heptose:LPS heptosyltransferase
MLAAWFGVERVPVTSVYAAFRARVLAVPLPASLTLPSRYVVIAPGCSEFGKERQLRPDEWRVVLADALDDGAAVVLLGGPADRLLCDAIAADLGRGQSLSGQLSIALSAGVLARAERFFGIDSLLLHLARALDVPADSVWGPSDPATRLRPRIAEDRLYFARMSCSPCIHVHEAPPCDGARTCIPHALAGSPHALGAVSTGVAAGWATGPGERTAHPVEVAYD